MYTACLCLHMIIIYGGCIGTANVIIPSRVFPSPTTIVYIDTPSPVHRRHFVRAVYIYIYIYTI